MYFKTPLFQVRYPQFSFTTNNTSIPSYMSETFPEYSNEGRDIVWCLSDITVFPEEGVISLHYAPEAVNQQDTSFYSTNIKF